MTEPQNHSIFDMLKTVYPSKTLFCGGYKEKVIRCGRSTFSHIKLAAIILFTSVGHNKNIWLWVFCKKKKNINNKHLVQESPFNTLWLGSTELHSIVTEELYNKAKIIP